MYPSDEDASEYAPQTAAAIKLVQLVAASPQTELHMNGSGKVSLAAPIEACFLPFLSSQSFVPSLDADRGVLPTTPFLSVLRTLP